MTRHRWAGGLIALGLMLVLGLAAARGAVTIAVDDAGQVTVHDPQGRVTVVRGEASGEEAETLEPALPWGGDWRLTQAPDAWPNGDGAIGWASATPQDWPHDADVLVLAWSEAQAAMVAGFSPRFTAPPVSLSAEQLATLPAGTVELQALWRVGGVVQHKATHRVEVPRRDAPPQTQMPPHHPAAEAPLSYDAGFTAWPLHPQARQVHVANDGDDAHDGQTPQHAVRTLARGLSLLRTGWGDHLLLRAGETFDGGFGQWKWSGRDAEFPLVVGVYGEGDRPKIVTFGEGVLVAPMGSRASHVVFQGLHILPARRTPTHPAFKADDIPYREGGLWWMASGENLQLEDCKIERFQFNVALQAGSPGAIRNVTLRRCIFVESFSHWDHRVGGHSSGLFATGVDGLRVEECVFDHNGWIKGVSGSARTKFNHNLYLEQSSRNLVVRDNIIARGASYGLQLRPGGEATGNLLARNALGMYFAWHPTRIVGNVVAESDDQGDGPDNRRGYGIEAWPCEDGLIAENLVMHKRGSADWAGAIEVTKFGSWQADVPSYRITIRDNTIVGWPVRHERDAIVVRDGRAQVTESGNVLDVASGGTVEPRFARPGMTLDDAAGGSFEAWLHAARQRPRQTWPAELTAAAIKARLFAAYRVVDP